MSTITHAIDTIEVGNLKNDEPILLDLNQIFGAIGLTYKVAVEAYGVVRVGKVDSRSQLKVSVGEYAEVGCRTRLVVRAGDGTGCSAAVVFNVEIVDCSVIAEARVA